MKIVRDVYVRAIETYVLEIDTQYVIDLNSYLQSKCTTPENLPYLESEDIINIFEGDKFDMFDKEFTWLIYHGQSFKETLADYVRDTVNDDLWNCDIECTETVENQEWEDHIER
jgi:hypothetical protein